MNNLKVELLIKSESLNPSIVLIFHNVINDTQNIWFSSKCNFQGSYVNTVTKQLRFEDFNTHFFLQSEI